MVSAPICNAGVGEGCEAAGENALIRQLQERSKANRAKNEAAVREKYWKEGYGSYFEFSNKSLVQNPQTGQWSLEPPNDPLAKALRQAGLLPDLPAKAETKQAK